MVRLRTSLRWLLFMCVLLGSLIGGPAVAGAAEAADESEVSAGGAATISDPSIAPADLKIRLSPMRLSQLEVELDAWFSLVQASAEDVAAVQLRLKREARARKEGEGGAKDDTDVDALADAIARRAAVVDRFRQVIAAVQEKGGEVEEHRQYLRALTGVTVDATDAGGTYKGIVAWLRSDEGGKRWTTNITKFVLIVLGFVVLAIGVGFVAKRVVQRTIAKRSQLLAAFVSRISRQAVLLFGFLIALTALEVDMTPIIALLGAAGFVVAFALQGTLSNLASGLMILAYSPFDVGDAVTAGGVSGKVASMNLFSTTITTFDNQVNVVPNNEIWNKVITNITGSERRRVDLVFGIGYESDHDKAAELLKAIVGEHPAVLEDPAPVIKLHSLSDSSVDFVCRPWCKTADYWDVYWDITRRVKEAFDREGISIPYPQRDVHIITGAPPADAEA